MHDLTDLHLRDAGSCRRSCGLGQAEAHPAHQVFGIEHADDVLGAALRIVDGNARVLLINYAGEGFFES